MQMSFDGSARQFSATYLLLLELVRRYSFFRMRTFESGIKSGIKVQGLGTECSTGDGEHIRTCVSVGQ